VGGCVGALFGGRLAGRRAGGPGLVSGWGLGLLCTLRLGLTCDGGCEEVHDDCVCCPPALMPTWPPLRTAPCYGLCMHSSLASLYRTTVPHHCIAPLYMHCRRDRLPPSQAATSWTTAWATQTGWGPHSGSCPRSVTGTHTCSGVAERQPPCAVAAAATQAQRQRQLQYGFPLPACELSSCPLGFTAAASAWSPAAACPQVGVKVPKPNSLQWEVAVRVNGLVQWLDRTFGKKE
jgi:hypothetical protein